MVAQARTRGGRSASPGSAAAVLVLLLAAAATGFGQEQAADAGTPRRVLLLVAQVDGAGDDADGLSLLYRSLLLGLTADADVRAAGTIMVEPSARSMPGTDDARTEAAGAAGADAWLLVEVARAPEGRKLSIRSFDAVRQKQVIDQSLAMENSLSPLGLPDADWSTLARLVARAYPPLRADSEGLFDGPTSARVSIHARPGSTVRVAGGPEVTIDGDGNAAVTLAAPAEYSLRVTAPGFSPTTQRVYVTSDREVTLRQDPGARWALEGALSDMAAPGLSLSWFVVPDSVFLGFGATTYAFALALNQEEVFLSLPLTNASFRMGLYLGQVDSPFRVYAAVAQFFRIIHAPVYFGLDPLSPSGTQFVLGAEIARTDRGGFFLEYVPTVYLTRLPNLFRASLGAYGIPPGWVFTPDAALNLLTFRVGYRWMP